MREAGEASRMPDLADGETTRVQGSGSNQYTLKNVGGAYSCSCPAWANQSVSSERRTCKHIRAFRGDEAEQARLGTAELSGKPVRVAKPKAEGAPDEPAEGEGPPILLAHKWETDINLVGFWISEKLDGVRAYWDGKQFISRLGNRFYAPSWFVEGLPSFPLDGELWGGRKKFQRTVGIVKRQDENELWKELMYVVFDAPSHDAGFEERIAHAKAVLEVSACKYVRVLEQERCVDHDHLKSELARVEALGGEGLMMRKPGSRYEIGRSTTLYKVKTFHDDEAVVVGYAPGQGKHKGRVGALILEMPNGTRFNAGTGLSDAERDAPPPIGSLVTYRYQELSDGGVPRFPSYVGVRIDAKAPVRAAPTVAAPVPPAVVQAPPRSPIAAPTETKVAPAATTASPSSGALYFELIEGNSAKFWEITLGGASFITRYGKIGSGGQKTLKEFASEAQAKSEHDKLVSEKTKKGYVPKTLQSTG
jgi:DNA ligase-1